MPLRVLIALALGVFAITFCSWAGPAGAARCTISGTEGNDRLVGTKRADVICAKGGNDSIRAKGGNDIVKGGKGNDRVKGAAGDDKLKGGAGRDELRGVSGEDVLLGGAGDDLIDGGPSADVIDGGAGLNTCVIDELDEVLGGCDLIPPELEGFSISPTTVDTRTDPAYITLTARFTDDSSGLVDDDLVALVRFEGPDGSTLDGTFYPVNLISGDRWDATYEEVMKVPRGAAEGVWDVRTFRIFDQAGNRRTLSGSDLDAAGFPSQFTQSGGP